MLRIIMGLIKHIVHHRGQVTVLMRQAGIKPFGVYGPPKNMDSFRSGKPTALI